MHRLIAFPVVLLAALAMSSPTTAKVDRMEFSGADYVTGPPVDDGRQWVSDDGQLHIRGLTVEYKAVSDSPYYNGTTTIVVNVNQDLATGLGTMWGTSHVVLDEFDGGFTGNWTAQFTGDDDPTWTGIGRSHGYGEVDGFQQRYTLTQAEFGDTLDGFTFSPGNK